MRTALLLLLLLPLACRPRYVLEPVYNCTKLTPMQQEDMRALIGDCESYECEQKVMQLYCDEVVP